MIRRSPTRIELKLEDMNDFDFVQKFEKKKNPSGGVLSSADAQKLVRQDRIGIGFRPIRSSSNVGVGQSSFSAINSAGEGGMTPVSDIGVPVTPTNNDNTPVDMNITTNSLAEGVNLILEADRAQVNNTNTSNMSLDDSL